MMYFRPGNHLQLLRVLIFVQEELNIHLRSIYLSISSTIHYYLALSGVPQFFSLAKFSKHKFHTI